MVGDVLNWFSVREGVIIILVTPIIVLQWALVAVMSFARRRQDDKLMLQALEWKGRNYSMFIVFCLCWAALNYWFRAEPWSAFVANALRSLP